MRDFFINSYEKLVAIIVVLMALGTVVSGLGMMAQAGFLAGLVSLVFGGAFVIFLGGTMYLVLGIYQNTRQTADAVARMTQERD